LRRHQDQLFTFLDRSEASWENNRAEREIRPAVILRKNSQCNRSRRGAATQAVLMSVYRTLRLRGHDPRQVIDNALTAYVASLPIPSILPHGGARRKSGSVRVLSLRTAEELSIIEGRLHRRGTE